MRAYAWLTVSLAVCLLTAARPAIGQPDLRQMNGMVLPSTDLPDGAISVRVVRQSLGNNVTGVPVTLTGAGVNETAPTDESGRAIFAGVQAGTTIVASVTVDGETVRSQPFQAPAKAGVRLILAAGLGAAATDAGPTPGTTPGATPGGGPAAPATPAEPARPGTIVLGNQWRTIVDFNNERLEVVHIFEFANAASHPVAVAQPLTIAMPAEAQQVTLLDGSTQQARVFERQLVVAGPFPPGRTVAQVAYGLPISGGRREIALTLPVASMATNVIVRRLGDTHLVAPTLPQSREAEAEGRKYYTGTGPGLPAGATLELVVDGIPHHPTWPRMVALGVAGLVVAGGLWLIFRVPVDTASRLQAREGQRTALLARLQRLEQGGEPQTDELREDRDGVLRDLEGIYALIDAERARSSGKAAQAERRAS